MKIIGVDEVGRGCWAGPLVAVALYLPRQVQGLTDSKLLSRTRRTLLYDLLRESGAQWGVGWVHNDELDIVGLSHSVRLAMERAVSRFNSEDCEVIIDGNINYLKDLTHSRAVIKADLSIAAVSAASIIAKVTRDVYMQGMNVYYPGYGFDSHVGYGTAKHQAALRSQGVTALHRRTFRPIRELL